MPLPTRNADDIPGVAPTIFAGISREDHNCKAGFDVTPVDGEAAAMRTLLVTIAMVAALAAPALAANDRAGIVRGSVVIAPACPGPARLDRPECLKRPVQATVKIFRATGAGGGNGEKRPSLSVATDKRGKFRVSLPAGTYRLIAVPPSPGPAHGTPVDITLAENATVTVELRIDSGLR